MNELINDGVVWRAAPDFARVCLLDPMEDESCHIEAKKKHIFLSILFQNIQRAVDFKFFTE